MMTTTAIQRPHTPDEILMLSDHDLNRLIALEVGCQQGHTLPASATHDDQIVRHPQSWYRPIQFGQGTPLIHESSIDFSHDPDLAFQLQLPPTQHLREDWIHVEYGPGQRWIVRLLRFQRPTATANTPWTQRELCVIDSDDAPPHTSVARGYSLAWLISRTTR